MKQIEWERSLEGSRYLQLSIETRHFCEKGKALRKRELHEQSKGKMKRQDLSPFRCGAEQ